MIKMINFCLTPPLVITILEYQPERFFKTLFSCSAFYKRVSSRHHAITPSRHHAITPSRHHAITPSRHHAITPSRHHAINSASMNAGWQGGNIACG
jgi:hypothetical protein